MSLEDDVRLECRRVRYTFGGTSLSMDQYKTIAQKFNLSIKEVQRIHHPYSTRYRQDRDSERELTEDERQKIISWYLSAKKRGEQAKVIYTTIAEQFDLKPRRVQIMCQQRQWSHDTKVYRVPVEMMTHDGTPAGTTFKDLTISQIAKIVGVPRITIAKRVERGLRGAHLIAPRYAGKVIRRKKKGVIVDEETKDHHTDRD